MANDPMSKREQAAWLAGAEAAAAICDAWAKENFLLAGDTVLMDPVLHGDISAAACQKSQTLQLHGAGHAYAAHAAQNIAKSIRALPLPTPPDGGPHE